MKKLFSELAGMGLALLISLPAAAQGVVIDASRTYGIRPDTGKSMTLKMGRALDDIRKKYNGRAVTLVLAPGRYDFYPHKSAERTYYISNHDQDNPKNVGLPVEGIDSLTIDGSGANLFFHARMLPIAVIGSRGCVIKDLHIDFEQPHINQITITASDSVSGISFETAPWVRSRINSDGNLEFYGEGWQHTPWGGILFEGDTRRVVYRTGDTGAALKGVKSTGPNSYNAPMWRNERIRPGMVMALRGWGRPAPGVFLSECVSPVLEKVRIHYAEGMGVLAQLCDSVTLREVTVGLRGTDDPRYFSTQADATHFSGCKGLISSTGGLYEGMMDDAINVHGTYLKVVGVDGTNTLIGSYMHGQSYGFKWGEPGDSVSFIRSTTMERIGEINYITSISATDTPTEHGAKTFRIEFRNPVPAGITENEGFGIENLSWTPEVYFAGNVIRNNRARGSLFSTPRTTLVENNLFDHTSGTAILLCGDCNGWYETGACRDVTIRNNRFINALTSMYQFTEGVISIYPEIPDLADQRDLFHGGKGTPGVIITDNVFESFDAPLLYAKSIDGLQFRNNRITFNHDYPAFHRNTFNVRLEHTRNVVIDGNSTPLSIKID